MARDTGTGVAFFRTMVQCEIYWALIDDETGDVTQESCPHPAVSLATVSCPCDHADDIRVCRYGVFGHKRDNAPFWCPRCREDRTAPHECMVIVR